jgi:hypothetical protein
MRSCCAEGQIYLVTFVRRQQGNDRKMRGNAIWNIYIYICVCVCVCVCVYIYIYTHTNIFTTSKTPMKLICSVYILDFFHFTIFWATTVKRRLYIFWFLLVGRRCKTSFDWTVPHVAARITFASRNCHLIRHIKSVTKEPLWSKQNRWHLLTTKRNLLSS